MILRRKYKIGTYAFCSMKVEHFFNCFHYPLMKRLLCRQFDTLVFLFLFLNWTYNFLHYWVWSAELLIRPLNANFLFVKTISWGEWKKCCKHSIIFINLFNDQQKNWINYHMELKGIVRKFNMLSSSYDKIDEILLGNKN